MLTLSPRGVFHAAPVDISLIIGNACAWPTVAISSMLTLRPTLLLASLHALWDTLQTLYFSGA